MSEIVTLAGLAILVMVSGAMAEDGTGTDYHADRFLICFRAEVEGLDLKIEDGIVTTGLASFDGLAREYGVYQLKRWLPSAREIDHAGEVYLSRIYRVWFARKEVTVEEAIRAFAEDENLLYAEPEGILRLCYTPNDPFYPRQWHLPQIQADLAWDLWTERGETPGDTTIVIGIVDTGVLWTHPDLIGILWQNLREDADGDGHTIELTDSGWALDPGDLNDIDDDDWDDDPETFVDDLMGWDLAGAYPGYDPDNDPMGSPWLFGGEHGTVVAGVVSAATDNGVGIASVAWRARIMPVKVTYDTDENGGISYGYQGILYAAQAGADIINCSWGGYGGGTSECALIASVHEEYGTVVCCASGGGDPWEPIYPAACPKAISVAATTFGDRIAPFSTFGPTIDLCAPGDHIWSTAYPESWGYTAYSGTSVSSSLAASCFGLLKSMFPDSGNGWLEEELLENCDNIDSLNPGYEGQLGHGRVNVYRAIANNLYPHLSYVSHAVQEEEGNGDGVLDRGEIYRVMVMLQNEFGWQRAKGVTAVFRSFEERIGIIDSIGSYNDISGGTAALNVNDPFLFSVFQEIGEGQLIPMEVVVRANQGEEWSYETAFRFDLPTSVEEVEGVEGRPGQFALSQNVPNPFNAETMIPFAVPRASMVELRVYNLRGELVRILAAGNWHRGYHTLRWDGRNARGDEVASGVYLCRLSAGTFTSARKLLLLK